MKPIVRDIDEVLVTLKSITRNKAYPCSCERLGDCRLKQQLSLHPSEQKLVATESLFNVRNTSTREWALETANWELIDTDGYAYKAKPLCDALRPPRTLKPSVVPLRASEVGSQITAGTQVDFILAFPELDNRIEIACISYSHDGEFVEFEINNRKPKASELAKARKRATEISMYFSPDLTRLSKAVERLEQSIDRCLNRPLLRTEADKLEKSIEDQASRIEWVLKSLSEAKRKTFDEDRFRKSMERYSECIENVRVQNEQRKTLGQSVDRLCELPSHEFEEYVATLLRFLGYQKVRLTPRGNDKGRDVEAEDDGVRIVAECKNYKKSKVGRPEIQKFMGAMQDAQAVTGFVFTTGKFSPQAQEMALKHRIVPIDGDILRKLGEVIEQARTFLAVSNIIS